MFSHSPSFVALSQRRRRVLGASIVAGMAMFALACQPPPPITAPPTTQPAALRTPATTPPSVPAPVRWEGVVTTTTAPPTTVVPTTAVPTNTTTTTVPPVQSTSAVWANAGAGTGQPRLDSVTPYPNHQGVQFLVNGNPDDRCTCRPNGFDPTGIHDGSVFHIYPDIMLSAGDELAARWTDADGDTHEVTHTVQGGSSPTTTAPPTTAAPTTTPGPTTTLLPGSGSAPRSKEEAVDMSKLSGYVDWTDVKSGQTRVFKDTTIRILYVRSGADVTLDNVVVNGGIWIYQTPGQPSARIRINNSAFMSESRLQIGSTPRYDLDYPMDMVVNDSFFYSPQGEPPAHTDAFQSLGWPTGVVFNRVGFGLGGPYNGAGTAPLNWKGRDTTFNEIWVGFLPAGTRGSYYAIYEDGTNNVYRCMTANPGMSGVFYPSHGNPVIEGC